MSNFNWNNYIGPHMSVLLRVKPNKFENTEPVLSYGIIGNDFRVECSRGVYTKDEIKPIIKSISDLTDGEWLFVFTGQKFDKDNIFELFVNDDEVALCSQGIKLSGFDLLTNKFDYSNQQILNRLYSLHVSLDYEELIKNNKAVRKTK